MDNVVMVEPLRFNEGQSMVSAPVLEECRILLQDFGKVTIEHYNREWNVISYELVRWCCVDTPFIWVDAPPYFIVNLLVDNISVIE